MPTATLEPPPALDTTPTLIVEPSGDHEALFFRVEIGDKLLRQIDQLHALLEQAPADADVTSITSLARANASLVTRYPRSDDDNDGIFHALNNLELAIDPDTGERHDNVIGYGGMTIVPAHTYPDPSGIFDERSLVYLRLHAKSHEISFESWYGDDSTVESRTITISTLRELLHTTSEAPA